MPPAPAAAPVVQTTEERWIVQSILEDLARMTLFAGRQPVPEEASPIVQIAAKPADEAGSHFTATVRWPGQPVAEQAIDLPIHIWNAGAYASVAAGFLARLQLEPERDAIAPAGGALRSLTAYDTESMEKENIRLSQWLADHPLDAEAHAQAALLLAAFGCREASGAFADARGPLNRATAHLAMAQALRGASPASDSATVASLLLSLLTSRQSETEALLAELDPRATKQPELRPWLMAARLRERKNWRLLTDYAKATPLERVEYFRAYEMAVGSDPAAREMEKRKPAVAADWTRIILDGDFSVPTGHVFAKVAIPLELKEISAIFPDAVAPKSAEGAEKLAQVLNQVPHGAVAKRLSDKPTVEVIDRGAWALQFQRHLCHAVAQTHCFLQDLWGVPEEAAKMRQACDQSFGRLWLYPLATLEAKQPGWLKPNAPGLRTLICEHPEWVETRFWYSFAREVRRSGIDSLTIPKFRDFYADPLPAGTHYGLNTLDGKCSRWECFGELQTVDPVQLDARLAMEPWNRGIAYAVLCTEAGLKPTPQQMLKAMEPFLDYDLGAMNACASVLQDQPEVYVRILRKAATFSPGYYLGLSAYLREHKQDKEAAEAFDEACANGADAVSISNCSEGPMNYYFEHGKKDRAEQIAAFAAKVYSARGLATMAHLRERQGRSGEAEGYYAKIVERYHDAGPIVAFYRRNGADQPGSAYAAKLKQITGDVFPRGIQKARLEDFHSAPQQGVLVAETNDATRRAGLKLNDIIVALNGDRTDSMEQYVSVRGFDTKPDMRLILYRDGGYLQFDCVQPDRVFGVKFVTYKGGGTIVTASR